MVKKDYYKILGVSKSANKIDIKKAYKRLAIKYHPDRNKGDKISEEKFKEIKEAYEVLIDDSKRSSYDKYGNFDFNNNNSNYGFSSDFNVSGDFGDIFGDVFGDIFGSRSKKRKKKDLDVFCNVDISLEEAARGFIKNILVDVYQKCSICKGTGCKSGESKRLCGMCKGNGNLKTSQGFFTLQQTCHVCNGNRYVIENPCYICRGEGIESFKRKISVKIPAGISENDRIKIQNMGHYGGLEEGGYGDIYINVKIKKHTIFKRKGNDIYCKIPITFTLAALGGSVYVPTLTGKVKLRIPSETQTGSCFKIYNKGIKNLKSSNFGNLLCKVIIETPVNLNSFQKKLLNDLDNSLEGKNRRINNPKCSSFFDSVKNFFNKFTK